MKQALPKLVVPQRLSAERLTGWIFRPGYLSPLASLSLLSSSFGHHRLPSWTAPVHLPPEPLEKRCPGNQLFVAGRLVVSGLASVVV
jgi:hypothetical protein